MRLGKRERAALKVKQRLDAENTALWQATRPDQSSYIRTSLSPLFYRSKQALRTNWDMRGKPNKPAIGRWLHKPYAN